MKVLVIGSGAREHAIAWKVKQSALLSKLYVAPGNPGTASIAENVSIAATDIQSLKDFALANKIDLTIVGPEAPLVAGIVDTFKAAGLRIFGPSAYAAQMEGSKEFAKEVMQASHVPTADYQTFSDEASAREYLKDKQAPLVIKADGLAAGKGVFVCLNQNDIESAITEVFKKYTDGCVIIEDFLTGQEASLIVATDGKRIVPLAPAHDYKRVFDNHLGPNTGGMGTVSPTPHLTKEQEYWALDHVIKPVLLEMERRGEPFVGFLYAGLMVSKDKINVLEFNARLGDPETQVILRRMDGDLLALLLALTDGTELPEIKTKNDASVCVVLAAHGYPENVRKDDEISGLDSEFPSDVVVFHAGTKLENGRILTNGGRVLAVSALGVSIQDAREHVYRAIEKIDFAGKHFRKDIGVN